MKVFFLFFILIMHSCGENRKAAGSRDITDTIINRNENSVLVTHKIVHADSITLLSTKCVLLDDSLQKVVNHITQNDVSDSINFLNHVSNKDILIKHYDINEDTLTCDVIYSTVAARFFFGSISIEKNNDIMLYHGPWKDYMGYSGIKYFKRTYKIYIPTKTRINKLLFRWQE